MQKMDSQDAALLDLDRRMTDYRNAMDAARHVDHGPAAANLWALMAMERKLISMPAASVAGVLAKLRLALYLDEGPNALYPHQEAIQGAIGDLERLDERHRVRGSAR